MGELYRFDLKPLIDRYGVRVYLETGTGKAVSLRHALGYKFDKYISIDVDPDLIAESLYLKKKYDNLTFIQGFSHDAIDKILPKIKQDMPILFFLDAHFPGADFHKISYEKSIRHFKEDAFPLEKEINMIFKHRDVSRDIFIIDDLILYEDGEYEHKLNGHKWEYGWLQEELGLQTSSDFLYDKFRDTHIFEKSLKDQGYLVLLPILEEEKTNEE